MLVYAPFSFNRQKCLQIALCHLGEHHCQLGNPVITHLTSHLPREAPLDRLTHGRAGSTPALLSPCFLEPGTEVVTRNYLGAAGALVPVSGMACGQEPAGPLGGSPTGWGISKVPTPLIPPNCLLLSLPSPDDSGLQRSGLLKGELHHAN